MNGAAMRAIRAITRRPLPGARAVQVLADAQQRAFAPHPRLPGTGRAGWARGRRPCTFELVRSALGADPGLGLVQGHAVQPEQVLAQDLALGLIGELRVAVSLAEVLRNLEVHERAKRPLRVEQRRLRA